MQPSVISGHEIRFSYKTIAKKNKHSVINGIDVDIRQGEIIALAGKNGAGKTTLLQHMNGLLEADSGDVYVCGIAVSKDLRGDLWRKVSLSFQYPEMQIFEANVHDEIAFGLHNLGLDKNEIETRIQEALTAVGLAPEITGSEEPLRLSGGMRRKLALASALAMQPEVFLFDEPLAGLDLAGRRFFAEAVSTIKQQGKTIIMIVHAMEDICFLIDRFIVISEGKKLADFYKNDFFEYIAVLDAAGVHVADSLRLQAQVHASTNWPEQPFFVREDFEDSLRQLFAEDFNAQ